MNPANIPNGVLSLPSEIRIPLLKAGVLPPNPSQYNPLLYPPDLKKAEIHGKATQVAKVTTKDPLKMTTCECCERNLDSEPISLWCKIKDLYPFRFCVPLYFHMSKFSVYLLLVLMFVYGIYALIADPTGYYSGTMYSSTVENKVSVLEILFDQDDILIQTGLIFGVIVIYIFMFQMLTEAQVKIVQDCQREIVSPSDYAIKITRLHGMYLTESDIRDFLMINHGLSDYCSIKKIILTHDIKELTELHRQRLELIRYRNKLLVAKPEDIKLDSMDAKMKKLQDVDTELRDIETKLKELEENCLSNPKDFKFSGTAIVILNQISDVSKILQKWKMTQLRWVFMSISSRYGYYADYKLKGRLVKIHSMPDPVDILWENIGAASQTKTVRTLKINLLTFLIMLVGAGIEFLMSYFNLLLTKEGKETVYFSILTSFVVVAVNAILVFAIRTAASAELHSSYTSYHQSVAEKLIINQFINTAIVPNLVHVAVYMVDPSASIQILDGLAYTMFFVFLSNALVGPALSVFDPWYFYKLWERRKLIKNPKATFTIQAEANALFEGPEFDIAINYAAVIKTIWLAVLYAPLIPSCIPISIGGLVLKYWVDKYLFLRRSAIPQLMGKKLAKSMIDYLKIAPLALAIGSLVINICSVDDIEEIGESLIISIAGVIISLLHLLVPVRLVYKKIASNNSEGLMEASYDEVRYLFPIDYERANPISQAAAMEDHLAECINKCTEEDAKTYLKNSLVNMKQFNSTYKGLTRNFQNYVMQNGTLADVGKSYIYRGQKIPRNVRHAEIPAERVNSNKNQDLGDIPLIYSQIVSSPKKDQRNQSEVYPMQPANPYEFNQGYLYPGQNTLWYPSFGNTA